MNITITISPDTIITDAMSEDYDQNASAKRYAEMVEAAVQAAYPDADLDVRTYYRGTNLIETDQPEDEDEAIRGDVDRIMQTIFERDGALYAVDAR